MNPDTCPQAMCTLLPLGYLLLASDSFHDLRWCLTPSDHTGHKLKQYYNAILTPRLLPIPCPGFLFPLYVTWIFIGMCPDWVGWCLFACYIPLCRRYYNIKKGRDDLRGWWTIVAIRVIMLALTYKGIELRGCRMGDYRDNLTAFVTQPPSVMFLAQMGNMTSPTTEL